MPHFGAALTNLMLLLDLPSDAAVGQLGLSGTPFYLALLPIVERVLDLDDTALPPTLQALDLVIVREDFDERAWRALRRGGWLVVLRERGARGSDPAPPNGQRATEIRRWLVSPSLAAPLALVPDRYIAMRAYELATRESGWKRMLRLAAIRFGWRAREFTGEVVALRMT
jgi:hypothetical protein